MLVLQNISYQHPNKDLLFQHLQLSISPNDKAALIANNGVGKSTLLKIIAKELIPSEGQVIVDTIPYYIPQIFGQYNDLTIAQALGIEQKLLALNEILNGNISEENDSLLDDDWTLEDRCQKALKYWNLYNLDFNQKLKSLSGGQKTKVFLASIMIHQPALILLDEPSNHLDLEGRQLLYDFIKSTKSALLIVSHDRKLLNILETIYELTPSGIRVYGGNYDFYIEQKQLERNVLSQDIQSTEKALRKAKEKERETVERQQKLDSRGKGKQNKAGVAKIMMNTLRNKAESSTSKLKSVHAEKIGDITSNLQDLRASLPDLDKIKFDFDDADLHKGKTLFIASNLNYSYESQYLWKNNLNIQINSGERIAIKGNNGSGKTSLIKLILGDLEPTTGTISRADNKIVYIDQDYSLIDNNLKVFEQAQRFNTTGLLAHEINIFLTRFLFTKDGWEKPCANLSGGEKIRLVLCCMTIKRASPDIIILDEPTNNLDIQNVEILTNAIKGYQGTLIVISHDPTFLKQINIEREIELT